MGRAFQQGRRPPRVVSAWGLKRRSNGHAKVEAAGSVALTPTVAFSGYGTQGWGTGAQELRDRRLPDAARHGRLGSAHRLLSIPAISRARDLLCSAIGSLPLTLWRLSWGDAKPVEAQLPPALWIGRPDPNTTRAAHSALDSGRLHLLLAGPTG